MLWFSSLFRDLGDAPGAAPAAPPVAPPAAPPAPAAPLTSGERLHQTFQNLRGQLTPDGSALRAPVDPNAPPAPPATPPADPPATPTRTDDGKFAPDGTASLETDPDATGDELPPDGEQPAGEGADDEEALRVVIPAMRGNAQPRVMFADTPEAAEELRALVRGNLRREELHRERARVERREEDLATVRDLIEVDPTGFLVQTLPSDRAVDVALALLAQDGVLDAVRETLSTWEEDPRQREIDRLKAEKDRADRRRDVEGAVEAKREARAFVREVNNTVDAITQLVPAERQNDLADDLLGEMQRFAQANPNVGRLTAAQMVRVFERRLSLYGVDPKIALTAVTAPGELPPARRGTPKGEAAQRIAAQAKLAREQGRRFRSSSEARRAAAAQPSAGSGVTPPVAEMPKENMRARIDRLRTMFSPNR
jgi:hypothetical protein